MIINSIILEEAGITRRIELSEKNNLVHSNSNSKGKTTLLRIILYSIGYNIPDTKLIKFDRCRIETTLTLDGGDKIELIRESRSFITLKQNNTEQIFILPSQENDLHKIIFKAANIDLINNLLGLFYFDQEKGWTLLNRGVVIGSIHFNIETLIRGINNIDCSELLQLKENKKQDLLKYKQMFSVSQYQETLNNESQNLATESYNSQIDSTINQYKIELNILKKERDRICKVLKENTSINNFISEIGLLVKTPNGDTIRVTENNIIGLADSIDLLKAKLKLIAVRYNEITEKIRTVEKERVIENQQLAFFNDEITIAQIFDQKIASIPINTHAVQSGITKIEKEIEDINETIRKATRSANQTITSIFNNYIRYRIELGLDGDLKSANHLFTSNLKVLSGAILHKTVFALRLACLVEVEKHLNIKLPIILDSPSGKEIDRQNIESMINILKRDFSENQIIIASIFEYNLPYMHKINIVNRLIEEDDSLNT